MFEGRPELLQRNGRLNNARDLTHLGNLHYTAVQKNFNTRHHATSGPQYDCVAAAKRTSGTGEVGTQVTIGPSQPENNGAEPGDDGAQETSKTPGPRNEGVQEANGIT